ncbi:MAG: hypothetical protein A2X61_15110 [Ignavibacteria bacterium GWB2_35_12]|nr:MAG: hypothetical protein A2X63_12340 [Ignavibacteria bacterium GWA2_35_8]OGU41794.1 MAG: hypothetical protein A2X61_15110 [Ignavibacteria bacterium GWB2_35_12]OGU92604.1 MAG: hypothetical protein A2220_02485 [Ignavibacteria bacterium RIFOXYA2_FULL_35_10]OGV24346.1 MAG: hypothetical protein A2475_05245 [Ignavibacteria bacterium RIFOXYC2_FULL_35_21]
MDISGIFDESSGRFTEECIELLLKSARNLVEPDDVREIVLLKTMPFSAENFLETKESIINGGFVFNKIDYKSTNDILFFYQVFTSGGKYYVIAHRDPFELYFNEAIIWYNVLPDKITVNGQGLMIYSGNNK